MLGGVRQPVLRLVWLVPGEPSGKNRTSDTTRTEPAEHKGWSVRTMHNQTNELISR